MYNNSWLERLLPVTILLGMWQISAWIIGNSMIWPDAWAVLRKLGELVAQADFISAVMASLFTATVGFGIVIAVTVTVSVLTHRVKILRQITCTLGDLIGPTPTLSWLPVFLIFFGFTKITLYLLMCWGVLWLMLQNLYALIDASQKRWCTQIQNLNLTLAQSWQHVYIPSMWPGFISLGKLYFMQIWRVLFSIEIVFGAVGGHQGLGTHMYDYKGRFDHVEVFACLLMIMIMGSIIGTVFNQLKKIFD